MAFIRKELNEKLRTITLSDLQRRGTFVSGEEATRISAILDSADHAVPFYLNETLFDIIDSDQLNRAFDLIWLDHNILIEDTKLLFNIFNQLIELTKEKLVIPRLQIKESISITRNYLKLKAFESFYNFVRSYFMGTITNEERINRPLFLDKESGIIHLPISKEKRYSSEAELNIKTTIISKGCKIVEQSSIEELFDPDLTWYTTLVADSIRNEIPYGQYNGVLLALDIELPTVIKVNTIKLRMISDISQEIVDVLYADNFGDPEGSTRIENYSVINNGFVTDISFSPIQTRRLRVVIGTKLTKEVENTIVVKNKIDPDYENKVIRELREIEVESLLSGQIVSQAEATKRLSEALYQDPIEVKKSRKIYIVGLRSIQVLYREYEAYGSFTSSGEALEGNLAYITMEDESVNTDGVRVVKKVIINSKEYSIGSVEEDGFLQDISVVRLGEISNPLKRYYFDTNFIPDENYPISIRAFGDDLENSNFNFSITERFQSGNRYYLSSVSEIVEGTTLTLRYKPAEFDRVGIEYDPRKLDIIRSIGKPNTKNNLIANRISRDIYFYDNVVQDTISRYSLNEIYKEGSTIRLPLDSNGNPRHGEQPSVGNIVVSGSEGYLELTVPYYGLYRGSFVLMEEEKKVDVDGLLEDLTNSSQKGTNFPYIKNMIYIVQGTSPAKIISEYVTNYGPEDDFKRVVVDRNSIDPSKTVKVFYHPIPLRNGTFDSTIKNNIERHNQTQNFVANTPTKEITLEHYPFVDPDIVTSNLFTKVRGTWFFKDRTSVIYEPFLIYIDGRKYEYGKDYTVVGKKISFTEPVSGNINIRYYTLSDRIGFKLEMFREEPLNIGVTARVLSILALGKVVK